MDLITCFGVFHATDGLNARHANTLGFDSLNGVDTFVIIHSLTTGTFTVLPFTIPFVFSTHNLDMICSSPVFGVNAFASFCHHLKAVPIARFPPAHSAILSGSFSHHVEPISNFAHASPHSIAIFVGTASFPSLDITHTLFGHTREPAMFVTSSPHFADSVVGSYNPVDCTNSFHFCHAC